MEVPIAPGKLLNLFIKKTVISRESVFREIMENQRHSMKDSGTAWGDVVITMDADLQDDPDEIPVLYQMITKGGFDLGSGWKKLRHDPLSKTLPSEVF